MPKMRTECRPQSQVCSPILRSADGKQREVRGSPAVFVHIALMGQIGNSQRFPASRKRGDHMPGSLSPGLTQESLKSHLKGRFKEVVMDHKGRARNSSEVSHHELLRFRICKWTTGAVAASSEGVAGGNSPVGWRGRDRRSRLLMSQDVECGLH